MAADGTAEHQELTMTVLQQLGAEVDNGSLCWWETATSTVIVDMANAMDFIVALAGVISVLRDDFNPEWVTGGTTAPDAAKVVQEWLGVGIEPTEVEGWLRAGCWSARAARRMVDGGLRPTRLLDQEAKPAHLVDVGPDGEIPVALAVADSYITVADAVKAVTRPRDSGAA